MSGDRLPIAVRAWAVPTQTPPQRATRDRAKPGNHRPRFAPARAECWPRTALILDTETTTDPTQRLTFGVYRYVRWEADGTLACAEEGFVVADDLPDRDPAGFAALQAYAHAHRAEVAPGLDPTLHLHTRRAFLDHVLWPAVQAGTLIVGFNLPFDLSRLAVGWSEARGAFAGGFSFVLWEYQDKASGAWRAHPYRPRLRIKPLDSKRARMGLARPAGLLPGAPTDRGRFLDLRTLGFALTSRGHSLASACRAFGVEQGKADSGEHGVITPDYIAYARQDVRATQGLLERLRAEYDRHPIALPPDRALSPASLAKAYLRAMGVVPPLARQPDFPPEMLGHAISAYFGGRAECRIRNVPVPVVHLDFLSMYPTVNALTDLWTLLIADRIAVVDATEEVRTFLAGATLDGCFEPAMWRDLCFFAQVEPDGDVLPVRAHYGGTGGACTIGVNPFTADEPSWYAGADLVASTLLTGKPPTVRRAVRLVPVGVQPELQPVSLGGAAPVDPTADDFFRAVIEERRRLGKRPGLSGEERARLDTLLKVLANSGSYGIFAEMNLEDLPIGAREAVTVYGADDGPFPSLTSAPERPGAYCFPPLASLITAAARLMLALLERCVTDRGGTYAICDTDSMAVVATERGGLVPCPGGPARLADGGDAVRTLDWAEVGEIVGRFTALNPYDPATVPGSILKVEDVNFAPCGISGHERDGVCTHGRRQLWCDAISAKRYALFNLNADGTPDIRKQSEHGLGHLLNPTDPDSEERDWIRQLWEGIVREALGQPYPWPAWLDQPAVSRLTPSDPTQLRPFAVANAGKGYADQIKPFNFVLSAHVARFGHPAGTDPSRFHLVAPYTADARQWCKRRWTNRYSGQGYAITTRGTTGGTEVARVQSYADVRNGYRVHPEPKSAGADGHPCTRQTRGLLQRRHVRAGDRFHIGKESNHLEAVDAGLVHDWDEVLTVYRDRRCPVCDAPLPPDPRARYCGQRCKQRAKRRRRVHELE